MWRSLRESPIFERLVARRSEQKEGDAAEAAAQVLAAASPGLQVGGCAWVLGWTWDVSEMCSASQQRCSMFGAGSGHSCDIGRNWHGFSASLGIAALAY